MTITVYHERPLIFIRAPFLGHLRLPLSDNEKCASSLLSSVGRIERVRLRKTLTEPARQLEVYSAELVELETSVLISLRILMLFNLDLWDIMTIPNHC